VNGVTIPDMNLVASIPVIFVVMYHYFSGDVNFAILAVYQSTFIFTIKEWLTVAPRNGNALTDNSAHIISFIHKFVDADSLSYQETFQLFPSHVASSFSVG
jgi:hypothetical protein